MCLSLLALAAVEIGEPELRRGEELLGEWQKLFGLLTRALDKHLANLLPHLQSERALLAGGFKG